MRRGALTAFLLLLAGAAPPSARSQALRLESLDFPETSTVGPWVSYRVRTQFRSAAPREYTQRVAIVGTDVHAGKEGFWVELKTEGLPSGTRIERGLFVVPAPAESLETPRARLVRYQVLTSGGKLYEYPVTSASELRAGAEVSTVELFEYDPATPAQRDTLGPDTLRIGRRVVPTIVDRVRMVGADTWPISGDRYHLNRPLLTQTYWRNPAVPITGFARSLFQVTMDRIPVAFADSVAADSAAAPGGAGAPGDSALAADRESKPQRGAPADTAGAAPKIVTKTELTLLDLGADAVPEVTQKPEEPHPASGDAAPQVH